MSALAAELAGLRVDVIVAGGGSNLVRTIMQATTTIPIVMAAGSDPVAAGLISSLARPGGNVTGLTSLSLDLSGKRVELLKEAIPKLSRLGVLWNPSDPGAAGNFKETERPPRMPWGAGSIS